MTTVQRSKLHYTVSVSFPPQDIFTLYDQKLHIYESFNYTEVPNLSPSVSSFLYGITYKLYPLYWLLSSFNYTKIPIIPRTSVDLKPIGIAYTVRLRQLNPLIKYGKPFVIGSVRSFVDLLHGLLGDFAFKVIKYLRVALNRVGTKHLF